MCIMIAAYIWFSPYILQNNLEQEQTSDIFISLL